MVPSQPIHATQLFLSTVLSQRGPSSLPYAEDAKWLIRQHLITLIENFPSLMIKTASFTHNDGRTVNLLQAEGTVPMHYMNVIYNLPIVIWLTETYPRYPPFVYLNPTQDMIIKRNHQHVNSSGLVAVPYLHNWIFPSSNLVDLARNLGHIFGRDPPLYTKSTRPISNAESRISKISPPGSASSSVSQISPVVRPTIPPRGYPPSPSNYSKFPQSTQRPSTEDPAEVYRRNSVTKLLDTIQGDLAGLRKNRETEMEGLIYIQTVVRRRNEELGMVLREMTKEKELLEQQLQIVLMNTDVLEAWVKENEGKNLTGDFDIDNVFEACDVLSKQALESTSWDFSIQDVIDALDEAVQQGSLPFDSYLRHIRALSREQFFHRALSLKVQALQIQGQVANMATRKSVYAV